MIPRLRPTIDKNELAALLRPVRSGAISDFEREFAALMGQRHAVMFPYGRTGLYVLLKALGLHGSEIICPAYTCVVVPHAIVASGNEPVFVDIGTNDFNMDIKQAETAVTEKTSALIATSVFGYPVNLDELDEFRRKHPDVIIIQDCAHSFAAEYRGRPVQKEGAAAIFGLNISKTITSIFGGMVTTDDNELAGRIRSLCASELHDHRLSKSLRRRIYLWMAVFALWSPMYSFVNRLERMGLLGSLTEYYDETIIDMPSDFLEKSAVIEASVGLVQLGKYQRIIRNRRQAAALYNKALDGLPGLELPPIIDGATYSHYVLKVDDRQRFLDHGIKHGVQFGKLIEYCVPEMTAYAGFAGSRYSYERSIFTAKRTVNLPVWVDRTRLASISNIIQSYCINRV